MRINEIKSNDRTILRYVHGVEKIVEDPIKIPTPYGGRLVWLLPGKNRLIVHMKDKNSIRHKKRWSQVNRDLSTVQLNIDDLLLLGNVYVLLIGIQTITKKTRCSQCISE